MMVLLKSNHRKNKHQNLVSKSSSNTDPPEKGPPEDNQVPGNNEISINYVHIREILE